MTEHRDLSDNNRAFVEANALGVASMVFHDGESLALAREAMINAFDRAAEQLDAQ